MRVLRQLPAWSPLTVGALWSGFRAAWLTDGTSARRALDEKLRKAYAPRGLYLTDSGTSALTIALRVAGAVTGAPVALPAYSCYDVATAADGAGVEFFLYDLDPETLSPALGSLRRAFEGGARSVVVAHLYGVPADLAAVQRLAAEFGAIVIEDAAQGSGCEWRGRPAGAHGALGVLSFGRGKGVTGGKGGALLVHDERLVAPAASAWAECTGPREPRGAVRDFVLLKAQWLFGRPALYWFPARLPFLRLGETIYQRPHAAGGISALAAGVLVQTLTLVSAEVVHRREVAGALRQRATGLAHVTPAPEWKVGWLRYPLLLSRPAFDALDPGILAAGITPGYPRSLADLDGFGGRRLNSDAALAGARRLAESLVTVPTHRFIDPDAIVRQVASLEEGP